MQLTIEVLASVRVGVATISVLFSLFLVFKEVSKARRKEPLPLLRTSALMASLLLLNSVLGLIGVPVNNGNSALLLGNIAATVSLLGALNVFVWRASRNYHA